MSLLGKSFFLFAFLVLVNSWAFKAKLWKSMVEYVKPFHVY